FDPAAMAYRLVLVGGLDGREEAAGVVLDAVRWFKTAARQSDRRMWKVSALPLAYPASIGTAPTATFPPTKGFFDDPQDAETRFLWRWMTYQVPDLIIDVRIGPRLDVPVRSAVGQPDAPTGSLAAALTETSNESTPGGVAVWRVTARSSD